MTYMIRFPIGDWSGDGHEKCEYFNVQSNYPVQHLREAHFKAPKVVGFDIGSICHEYEDGTLSDDVIEKLNAINLKPEDYGEEYQGNYSMYPDGMVNLWLDILCHIDPALKLELVKTEAEPINFYGFDDQGRHLKTPGYGLFYL